MRDQIILTYSILFYDLSIYQPTVTKTFIHVVLITGESALLKFATNAACQSLVENEELLNRLDSRCGDGDCGSTLKTAAKSKCELLSNYGHYRYFFMAL